MRFFSFILMMVAAAGYVADATVVTYPAGAGVETISDFKVLVSSKDETSPESGKSGSQHRIQEVRFAWVDCYPMKVARMEMGKSTPETASVAYFDFDEDPVEVRVISAKPVESVLVRPLSYNITPTISGDTISFTLYNPANISVEVNGDIFHNLHLFANPIDKHRPTPKEIKKGKYNGGKLVYYGPGLHRIDGIYKNIPSNTTVYIDGGARIVGQLVADSVENVKFFGRGIIYPEGRGEGIYIKNSRNIEAEGVIVTQIPVGGCDGVHIENVKSLSSYGWGDGMNVFASDNISYDRVFCRNSDDCSTVYATRKGFTGGCDNIKMENSTLWADVAHPIMIGLHGNVENPDTISNIVYRNLDILDQNEAQVDYQGVFAISCGDNNLVTDVLFDNCRVEQFRQGQLVNIRIFFNKKYCLAPGIGIRNVTFKDITYNGAGENLSIIAGYDDTRTVDNIVFDNLMINGVHISDEMPGKPKWYKTSDFAHMFIGEHVNNVIFK